MNIWSTPKGKIHSVWLPVKNYQAYQRADKYDKKKKKERETCPELTRDRI